MMAAYRVQKPEEEGEEEEEEIEGREGGEGEGEEWNAKQVDEQWYRDHDRDLVLSQATCRRYLARKR